MGGMWIECCVVEGMWRKRCVLGGVWRVLCDGRDV